MFGNIDFRLSASFYKCNKCSDDIVHVNSMKAKLKLKLHRVITRNRYDNRRVSPEECTKHDLPINCLFYPLK